MNHEISGSVALETFFAALGTGLGSAELEAVVALVGADVETGPVQRLTRRTTQYLQAPQAGVEVLLTDGAVSTVFLTVRPDGAKQPYAGIGRLFDGVDAESSRETIRSALEAVVGPVVRSKPTYDFFGSDGRFVHVQFDDHDRLERISLTAVDVLARRA